MAHIHEIEVVWLLNPVALSHQKNRTHARIAMSTMVPFSHMGVGRPMVNGPAITKRRTPP